MSEAKTVVGWAREGRRIAKDAKAETYLVDDAQTRGRGLFTREQTVDVGAGDFSDGWTTTLTAAEWDEVKQANRELKRKGPHVKVQAAMGDRPGTEVWCGPNKTVIEGLQKGGWKYQGNHYWYHAEKTADQVQARFEQLGVKVERLEASPVI